MICETVNCGFKLHKLNIPPQNTSFWVFCCRKFDLWKCQLWLEIAQMRYFTANTSFCAFYKWKISFVQMPTLTLNCTNAIIHRKTRIFDCFTVKKPICATANFDFKSHKCNIPHQNTYFWVFWCGKSDLCKCQLWLDFAQMRYSTAKNVFLFVLQWKISFVQVPTLTLNCTNKTIHR